MSSTERVKAKLSLCEMVDEKVYTKRKVLHFPTPLLIESIELDLSPEKIDELVKFLYSANGKIQTSKYQIGLGVES